MDLSPIDSSPPSSAPLGSQENFTPQSAISRISSLLPHPDAMMEDGPVGSFMDCCKDCLKGIKDCCIDCLLQIVGFLLDFLPCLFCCSDTSSETSKGVQEIESTEEPLVPQEHSVNFQEQPIPLPPGVLPFAPKPLSREELQALLNTTYPLPPEITPFSSTATVTTPVQTAPVRSEEDLRVLQVFEIRQDKQELIDIVFFVLVMLHKYSPMYRTTQFYLHLRKIQKQLDEIHPLIFSAHLLAHPHLANILKRLHEQYQKNSDHDWWALTGEGLRDNLQKYSKSNRLNPPLNDFVRYLELKADEWRQNPEEKLKAENERLEKVGEKLREVLFIRNHINKKSSRDFDNLKLKKSDLSYLEHFDLDGIQKMFNQKRWNDFYDLVGQKPTIEK